MDPDSRQHSANKLLNLELPIDKQNFRQVSPLEDVMWWPTNCAQENKTKTKSQTSDDIANRESQKERRKEQHCENGQQRKPKHKKPQQRFAAQEYAIQSYQSDDIGR